MFCDEVQCGVGRTGNWFGFQAYGIEPDAFSLAKSLGSGYPIGAVVSNPKLGDVFQPGNHASTFGGTPPLEAIGALFVWLGSLMAALFGFLRLTRAYGYEFVRVRRRGPARRTPPAPGEQDLPK